MTSSHTGKTGIEGKGLRYKLLIIEVLIFVLPFLIIFYIFYRNNVFLEFSQIIIFALILALILSGLIILRQIFDRFFMVATLMKKAAGGDEYLIDIQKDTDELHEITVSFNSLMKKFDETTSELRDRVFELFVIKELTEVASKSLDIDDLLTVLLEKAMTVSKAQTGSALMVESEKERFRVVASRGLESCPKKDSYININESLARLVVYDKKPLLVQDIEADSRTRKLSDPKYGSPSFLSMPIFAGEDVITVLNLSHKETKQVFDSNDEQILSIMIGEIGFALENAQLHSKVEEHLKILQDRSAELTTANDQLQQEITERKRAEEKLGEYRNYLEDLVEKRTAELTKTNKQLRREITERKRAEEKLQKKNEELENFVYVVSHDLKSPIVSMQGFSSMLLNEYREKLGEEGERYLERIKANTRRMEVLISDLLAISKLGRVMNPFKDVSSLEIANRACENLKQRIEEQRIKVFIRDNLPTIRCDRDRICQVLENLVSNAIKFMGDTDEPRIEIGYEERREFHRFYVRDNGIGIDPKYHRKIFDILHRLKEVGDDEGTGIGLVIAEKVVRDHGGKVWVESEKGKGATFYFTLPK